MPTTTTGIRAAFPSWADQNRRLRDRVATLSASELAIKPAPDRWPLWATIGHLACQRVFGMCDVAGEPGAAGSPFPNAGYDCPGDDDLERVWSAEELVDALDRSFAIVEGALDTWAFETLGDEIRHDDWGPGWTRTRGEQMQRTYAHDIWHIGELNDALGAAGLEQIDLWS